jgi:hypothetical protein
MQILRHHMPSPRSAGFSLATDLPEPAVGFRSAIPGGLWISRIKRRRSQRKLRPPHASSDEPKYEIPRFTASRHRHMKPPPSPSSPIEGAPPPPCVELILRGPCAIARSQPLPSPPHMRCHQSGAAPPGGAVAGGRSRTTVHCPSRQPRHGHETTYPRHPLHRRPPLVTGRGGGSRRWQRGGGFAPLVTLEEATRGTPGLFLIRGHHGI